jgi:REP element-mobilizing transposase RayT
MPDHLHVVIVNRDHPLHTFVRLVKRSSTRDLNDLGFERRVWQRGYYDHIIRRDEDLFETIGYVLLNPVRAGLTQTWYEYPWSGSIEWPGMDDSFLEHRRGDTVAAFDLFGDP